MLANTLEEAFNILDWIKTSISRITGNLFQVKFSPLPADLHSIYSVAKKKDIDIEQYIFRGYFNTDKNENQNGFADDNRIFNFSCCRVNCTSLGNSVKHKVVVLAGFNNLLVDVEGVIDML